MKTAPATLPQVMALLESRANEGVRRLYAKQGGAATQFGVSLGDLRGLARKLKRNHPLGLELWATGNVDAQILATMVLDPARLTQEEVERMAGAVTVTRLADELVFNVVAHTPFADALRARWVLSPDELLGRCGWNLLVARVTSGQHDGLDLDALLRQLEGEMLGAPKRKQEVMSRALVEIGVHRPERTAACVDIGTRLGRFDTTPVPKGCVAPYAPEWIAAVLKRKAKQARP